LARLGTEVSKREPSLQPLKDLFLSDTSNEPEPRLIEMLAENAKIVDVSCGVWHTVAVSGLMHAVFNGSLLQRRQRRRLCIRSEQPRPGALLSMHALPLTVVFVLLLSQLGLGSKRCTVCFFRMIPC
jgi:hypothetical protein